MPDIDAITRRFWAKVDRRGPDECWPWTAARYRNGYGSGIGPDGRQTCAHRIAWILTHGSIPAGLTIDHLCRVKHCVNPAHMEVVTRGENSRRAGGIESAARGHAEQQRRASTGIHAHRRTPISTRNAVGVTAANADGSIRSHTCVGRRPDMDDEALDAIEARANAATPGPWRIISTSVCRIYGPDAVERRKVFTPSLARVDREADAGFIAAAREDVPALAAEVRRLREELVPPPCVMTHTPPFDFAQCETHDTTFPLGSKCRFDGREMWEVFADGEHEQRMRAVRAEAERDELRGRIDGQAETISRLGQVAAEAGQVMEALDEFGPTIVAHLLDTDDNAGQRLRDLLREVSGWALNGTTAATPPAPGSTVHRCPPGDSVTPCCGRTMFDLPRTDRVTVDPHVVTCTGQPVVWRCEVRAALDGAAQPEPAGRDNPCGRCCWPDDCADGCTKERAAQPESEQR